MRLEIESGGEFVDSIIEIPPNLVKEHFEIVLLVLKPDLSFSTTHRVDTGAERGHPAIVIRYALSLRKVERMRPDQQVKSEIEQLERLR